MTTAREFLDERRDWLNIRAVPGKHGGWDVALIIDGTYTIRYLNSAELLAYWTERLAEVLASENRES